ncbi:MAG TPA: hypothetical protein VMW95_05620 [Desulfobacterales bacterium]|nr:hypothetical protein [Desulfobacterales bacterium]
MTFAEEVRAKSHNQLHDDYRNLLQKVESLEGALRMRESEVGILQKQLEFLDKEKGRKL